MDRLGQQYAAGRRLGGPRRSHRVAAVVVALVAGGTTFLSACSSGGSPPSANRAGSGSIGAEQTQSAHPAGAPGSGGPGAGQHGSGTTNGSPTPTHTPTSHPTTTSTTPPDTTPPEVDINYLEYPADPTTNTPAYAEVTVVVYDSAVDTNGGNANDFDPPTCTPFISPTNGARIYQSTYVSCYAYNKAGIKGSASVYVPVNGG